MERKKTSDILKDFGFQFDELNENKLPKEITIAVKTGQHYIFKTQTIIKISTYLCNVINSINTNVIILPDIIDHKFVDFLVDYANFVEQNNGIPSYTIKQIEVATTLENAIGPILYKLFEKHFNYKFVRSDIAVKQYLSVFGHFLKCANAIIAEPLITIFAIAHKIILQHLPSSEFIIINE